MKFALVSYGNRGDIEPCLAVGRELLRRGHEVHMAVPPDLIHFVESTGLTATVYGLDTHARLEATRTFWAFFFQHGWKVNDTLRLWREVDELFAQCWGQMTDTLMSMAGGADVLLTGLGFEQAAANVAEYHDIPLATLHYMPIRVNGQLLPAFPPKVVRSAMSVYEWIDWRAAKKAEDAQRDGLGLPKATKPWPHRITERKSLELQAYDRVFFGGLEEEWKAWNGRRPIVGGLSLELATVNDDEVASWISAGTPPIFFGFGSTPVQSPAKTVQMISEACAELGERALIGSGWRDFGLDVQYDNVKLVGTVNYAETFPKCRAVVHHGGAGTTAAGLRAAVPTLILWTWPDQPVWGAQVKRLGVGTARRFSSTTRESLAADLRRILASEYRTRAGEVAKQMTHPAENVSAAVDLVEQFAKSRTVRH